MAKKIRVTGGDAFVSRSVEAIHHQKCDAASYFGGFWKAKILVAM